MIINYQEESFNQEDIIDYNHITNNNLKNKIIIISFITDELILKLKDLYFKGLIIKDNRIVKICSLIENIKSNVIIYELPFKEEVIALLTKRKTYQGFYQSILNEVKRQVILNVKANDYVIDATVGNGNDTLFLAKLVPEGKVFGFDIQKEAIENTKIKVANFSNVYLYLKSHEYLNEINIDHKVKLIVFNLGYLPGNNKKITTQWKSTLKALEKGLNLLSDDGLILVVVYPGHEEGLKESKKISQYLESNNICYQVKRNTSNVVAPYLIIIYKKRDIV